MSRNGDLVQQLIPSRNGLLALIGFSVVAWLIFGTAYALLGLLLLNLIARILARYVADGLVNVLPGVWRAYAFRGWHGAYRAFEGQQVRVLDGDYETPTLIVAVDLFVILGLRADNTTYRKYAARYPNGFVLSEEEYTAGLWVFEDTTAIRFLEAHAQGASGSAKAEQARRLLLWLSKEVLPPIDNKRTKQTGKHFVFTNEGIHGLRPQGSKIS